MSELKELTHDIITNAFIKALADIDKGTAERDKHFVVATELIIKNFKAHIRGCERPPNRHINKEQWHGDVAYMNACQWYGAEDFRKALMELLE